MKEPWIVENKYIGKFLHIGYICYLCNQQQ